MDVHSLQGTKPAQAFHRPGNRRLAFNGGIDSRTQTLDARLNMELPRLGPDKFIGQRLPEPRWVYLKVEPELGELIPEHHRQREGSSAVIVKCPVHDSDLMDTGPRDGL